ncbi:MAG: alpha/beta fold hydrolase [Anaerolineales bacterium]|jgi:pimeloyl-ACP methyl ester carboxylesterase|uniref:alpha/beta hydrolase n=1 Tax=Candidatus Villigracilis affinis TaxID=3140682 RepID=UPI001B433203|nr:alpha/beta fold hydrolase [Anaerolineales bacterium]MBK9600314.1 alpha/beta fold hydrolase [Anaerolineales bacterium]MBL0346920.1 alpha/beta fold hydrolase [Anaerolineales bacterium]MBP8048493.1 alpha/beta fold hydrolase [Anaerolineales bacterium]
MYRKGWRYYRNVTLLWILFFVVLMIGGYALEHPLYWTLVLFIWVLRSAFGNAFQFAHPSRRFNWDSKSNLVFKEVTFKSRDGLTLFGRFHAGRNRAVIILIHGLGGAGTDMLVHASFLVNAGYGVFMIDLRAHGSSDGDTSTYGLREADDVAGAVDYLLSRVDVNGAKIGALGISLGAQAALRGALKTDKIRALVLDGLSPARLSDHGGSPRSIQRWLNLPFNWLYYRMYEYMIRGRDAGVLEVIGRIAPRPILLIASGSKDIYFSRLFYEAAKDPRERWEIHDGLHGVALAGNPQEYIDRVVGFFNRTLP